MKITCKVDFKNCQSGQSRIVQKLSIALSDIKISMLRRDLGELTPPS